MESNRKRRGFMKGKLAMPFYRAGAAQPSSTAPYSSSKVMKPSQSSPAASVSFIVNQDCVTPQPAKQKVSFIVPDNGRDSFGSFESPFGAAGDESVDMKAASYISCVQERFRLERAYSERKIYQDMH